MTPEETAALRAKDHQNYFPLEAVLSLHEKGLDDESLAELMTAGITTNKAREKLQLPPLDDPLADELFCLEPYGLYHILGPACVDKVRDRFIHSESDLARKFWKDTGIFRNERIEALLQEGVIDLAEHDRILSTCLLAEQECG